MEVLRRRQGNGSKFVLPGTGESGHLEEPKMAWANILKRAGLTGVRIHDLRHTFASMAVSHGVALAAVGAILGHKDSRTTDRYAHLSTEAKKISMDTTAAAMQAAVEAAKAKLAHDGQQAAQDAAGAANA
jgi:site-specific recombinase XerD